MPLESGAPREILNDVTAADWAPDGKQMAVVRYQPGKQTLEYPIGKTLHETQGWIGNPRFSPDGKRIAFIDHTARNDDGGAVAVVDLAGNKKDLTEAWSSIRGMAWNPTRDEIWFTASALGASRGLYAVNLSGKSLPVAAVPGTMTLFDVAKDGHALVAEANERVEMAARSKDWTGERSLSWLDWTLLADLSADGKTVLFTEGGEGGGPDYATYVRKIDGSPAVRLGEGQAFELSPDGRWCVVARSHNGGALFLVPTGAGELRQLTSGNLTVYGPTWLPGGIGVLYSGRENGHKARVYLKKLDGSAESALTSEGFTVARHGVSPDSGSFLAIRGAEKQLVLVPIKGGDGQAVPGVDANEIAIQWAPDGHSIYAYKYGTPTSPSRISEVDIKTDKRDLVKAWMPDDRAGYAGFDIGQITPDGKTIAYSYTRVLGDLYLVEAAR
jgi:eukaryotic-like serine/threonine-protein kinase